MDGSSPRNRRCDDDSFDPQSAEHQLPCAACRDCRSIHGLASSSQECVLKGCYVCADLSRINDEISSTYQHLSDLVKEREEIMEKPRHDTLIYRMPVEILASIFFFVEEAILSWYKNEEHPDHGAPKPAYRQLVQSPPLLLGAVCKRWRDITLETPQLWTNIAVDLEKPTDGQLDMVKKWTRRSGVLPLNITIFPGENYHEIAPLYQYEDLISALRSLVVRWNNVGLYVPATICHALLNNLPEAPQIGSMFLNAEYCDLKPIGMQGALRPRRLLCKQIYKEIPFGWDRLVFLEVKYARNDDILYAIRHAPNLRYCIAPRDVYPRSHNFPMPTSPITNRSLIYLSTGCNIFNHLTLPSLLHLDCEILARLLNHDPQSLIGFLDRSCAPLPNFILRCHDWGRNQFPSFERLAGTTHLFLSYQNDILDLPIVIDFFHALTQPTSSPILPRLKTLEIHLPSPSASSWSLFVQAFPKDIQANPSFSGSAAIKRPLSRVVVRINSSEDVSMDRDTFFQILEVKKSGVNLVLKHDTLGDLFHHMAQVYDIEL